MVYNIGSQRINYTSINSDILWKKNMATLWPDILLQTWEELARDDYVTHLRREINDVHQKVPSHTLISSNRMKDRNNIAYQLGKVFTPKNISFRFANIGLVLGLV